MGLKRYINSKMAAQLRIRKGGNQTWSDQIKPVPLVMAIRKVLEPDTVEVLQPVFTAWYPLNSTLAGRHRNTA